MAGFFTRAVGDTPTPPDARTHHLRLSHAGRSRTLAILVRLAHRALRGRQVLTLETMTDDEARLVASLPTEEELRTGCWSWQHD